MQAADGEWVRLLDRKSGNGVLDSMHRFMARIPANASDSEVG